MFYWKAKYFMDDSIGLLFNKKVIFNLLFYIRYLSPSVFPPHWLIFLNLLVDLLFYLICDLLVDQQYKNLKLLTAVQE